MKTLDEVIEILDGIDQECTCCAFQYNCDETECIEKTALHYLKEYQRYQNTPSRIGHMAMCDENEPLTMEYFSKQIDTEPIWCEKLGEWYLFLAYDDGENEIQLMSDKGDIETFDEEDLEKYPLYRRK